MERTCGRSRTQGEKRRGDDGQVDFHRAFDDNSFIRTYQYGKRPAIARRPFDAFQTTLRSVFRVALVA
jgi:hypothetical protein